MDGIHDVGGKQGFGRVEREADEPPFHEPWEGRAHGIGVVADLGPGFRHAIELMDPVAYLTTSYYEHWLHSFIERGVAHGMFTRGELDAWERRIAAGEPPLERSDPGGAAEVRELFTYAREPRRHDAPPPRHAVGERVRVMRVLPAGHTRCPGYLRGATGVVERVHAPQPLLDVYENEDGRVQPEAWYTVAFDACELWELDGMGHTVLVDLWESHLEDEP
jgi:nitrile hydratase subunit beta